MIRSLVDDGRGAWALNARMNASDPLGRRAGKAPTGRRLPPLGIAVALVCGCLAIALLLPPLA